MRKNVKNLEVWQAIGLALCSAAVLRCGGTTRRSTLPEENDRRASVDADVGVDSSRTGGHLGRRAPPKSRATTWVVQFGSSGSDDAYAVAVDQDGNVVVTGSTSGDLRTSSGEKRDDVFVRKLRGTDGRELWTAQFGDINAAFAVALDSAGDVFITGTASSHEPRGKTDVFVRKLSGIDGAALWSVQFGTSGTDWDMLGFDSGSGVAVDSDGDVLVTGTIRGELARKKKLGDDDAFVRKLSGTDGSELWTVQFGSPVDLDHGNAVAVDSEGSVLVAGTTSFGQGWSDGFGGSDAFVRKLSGTDGSELWTAHFGSNRLDRGLAMAVDVAGSVFVAGQTYGDLARKRTEESSEGYVRKLSGADGRALWTVPSAEATGALAVDSAGRVLALEYVWLERDRGAKDTDVLVRKLSGTDGRELWSERLGTSDRDQGHGVAVDSEGSIFVVGSTRGDLAGTGNAGNRDAFVVKLVE